MPFSFFALRRLVVALFFSLGLSGASATVASASHFRGGQITWKRTSASVVDFQVTGSFRRDGYDGTATDGHPAIGDVITETIGDTDFSYGDGRHTSTLQFKVIAIVPAENYLIGRALAPGSSTNTVLEHDYANPAAGGPSYPTYPSYPSYPGSTPTPTGYPGAITASLSSCCTIGALHNNGSGDYRVETHVTFNGPTASPNTSLKPIVNVGTTGVQHFQIPAVTPAGTTRRFRLATAAEACDGCSGSEPDGLTIDASSGDISFDPTGKPLGLYFASIVVEALAPGGAVAGSAQQTFLINVSPQVDQTNAGFYPSAGDPTEVGATVGSNYPGSDGKNAPDGSTFYAPPKAPFRLKVTASDPTDSLAILHVDNLGLPDGATFVSNDGNPASGLLEWSPTVGQVGDFIVTFTVSKTGKRARVGSRAASTSAGINTQTISYALHVDPDSTPPVATPAAAPVCSATGNAGFTVVDNPGGVGASALDAAIDGGAKVSHPLKDGAVTLSLPEEGHHTVVYSGRDLNGNSSATGTLTLITDRTPPHVMIALGQPTYVLGASGSATVSATDDGSLTANPSGDVVLDTSTVGSHTIEKTATDSCGQVTTAVATYAVTAPLPPAAVHGGTAAHPTPLSAPIKTPAKTTPKAPSKLAALSLPSKAKCLRGSTITIKVIKTPAFKHVVVTVNGIKRNLTIAKHAKALKVKIPKARKIRISLSALGEVGPAANYHRCG